jgi:hypothetical protein
MTKRERFLGGVTFMFVLSGVTLTLLAPDASPTPRPGSKAARVAAAQTPPPAQAPAARPAPVPGLSQAATRPASVQLDTLLALLEPPEPAAPHTGGPDPVDPFIPLFGSGSEAQPGETASDPTTGTSEPASTPTLEGVFLAGSERVALVDGRTLRPGDRFQGYTVQEVRQNGVVLKDGARQLFLGFSGLTTRR